MIVIKTQSDKQNETKTTLTNQGEIYSKWYQTQNTQKNETQKAEPSKLW